MSNYLYLGYCAFIIVSINSSVNKNILNFTIKNETENNNETIDPIVANISPNFGYTIFYSFCNSSK